MKKLLLFLLILSLFIFLIYASSEPNRSTEYEDPNKLALPNPMRFSSPELRRLRTCLEDEFNCSLLGEDYTQCVKKFKICNRQIRCSNDDQLVCPLCDRNSFYCDQLNVSESDKCVELKEICFNSDKQINCSTNQTMIKDKCNLFKLSKPNTSTLQPTVQPTVQTTTTSEATEATEFSTSPAATLTTTDYKPLITTTETSSLRNETTTYDQLATTTQAFNLTTQSSTSQPSTTEDSIDKSTTEKTFTTEPSVNASLSTVSPSVTNPSVTKSSTTKSSVTKSTSTTTKKPSKFFKGPKDIIDYSRFFKHDYGGFNFTKFLYKFDKNKKGDDKKDNSSSLQFYDYSKFMSGGNGGSGFDYSKYMNGMFDYSKFMGNSQQQSNDTNKEGANSGYSKYMNQFTGNGTDFDYSKYMNNGQGKNGEKSKEWGTDNYDYSRYKGSGMKSSQSDGSNFYKNDIKSGQQNQDKYAKGNYDYGKYMGNGNAGGQTDKQSSLNLQSGQPDKQSSLNLQSGQNSNKPKESENQMGGMSGYDYSKYLKQYTSSKTGSNFDYTKYMKGQGGYFDYSKFTNGYQGANGKPNTDNSNLIKLTGSRQPTKSFTSWFDYSKYLRPGGHQETGQADDSKTKKLELKNMQPTKSEPHKAGYLNDFTDKISKINEERVKAIEKEGELENKDVDASLLNGINGLSSRKESSQLNNEPILMEQETGNDVNRLQSNELGKDNYHHIEMQKQVPQYRKFNKEPSVNVSKIIPNMMTNRYNYTHYGSGVFFINFGTIVNGNNNINGDGNDVGNGNGNGNNNGNTQGDGLRIPSDYSSNSNQPKKPPPSPESSDSI